MAGEGDRKENKEFFVGRSDEHGGEHLVAWKEVCKPKEFGVLGIGNVIKRNKALLFKWLWRLPLEHDSMWYKVIISKYGLCSNGWDSNIATRVTYRCPWKFIS